MRTEQWDRETFRQVLGYIQDRTQLTEADLAALAGRSRSQVNRWTRAENQPAYEPIRRLVDGLEKFGPDVRRLGIKLLEAAGYAPPETAGPPPDRTGSATITAGTGVRVEQRDDSHVTYEVTVEAGLTMDEARAALEPLAAHEGLFMHNLELLGLSPADIQGMVLFLRRQVAENVGQREPGQMRREA